MNKSPHNNDVTSAYNEKPPLMMKINVIRQVWRSILSQGTLRCDWISEQGLKIVCSRFPSEKKHNHYNIGVQL